MRRKRMLQHYIIYSCCAHIFGAGEATSTRFHSRLYICSRYRVPIPTYSSDCITRQPTTTTTTTTIAPPPSRKSESVTTESAAYNDGGLGSGGNNTRATQPAAKRFIYIYISVYRYNKCGRKRRSYTCSELPIAEEHCFARCYGPAEAFTREPVGLIVLFTRARARVSAVVVVGLCFGGSELDGRRSQKYK